MYMCHMYNTYMCSMYMRMYWTGPYLACGDLTFAFWASC